MEQWSQDFEDVSMPTVIIQKGSRPVMPDTVDSLTRTSFVPGLAAFKRRSGRSLFGMAACGGLLAAVGEYEHWSDPARLPLFLFFSALALLAVMLPATGPHGQRVGLIPAVGLAALLLLPPVAAVLPVLLANTAYAFSCEMTLSRRMVYERGFWLLLATLSGGLLHVFLTVPAALQTIWPASETLAGAVLLAVVYSTVFTLGRLFSLGRHFGAQRTVRRHAFQHWRLEAVTLAVTAPIAVMMALIYPDFGLLGIAGAAVLLALMGVVAHFGFEVASLRDQVRAMEKISAVTVSQTSAPRVIDQFLRLSSALVSCDRVVLWLTDESDIRLERTQPGWREKSGSETADTEPISVRFGEGLVGRAAERKKPLLIRDGAHDPRLAAEEQRCAAASFSMLLLPLVAGNQTMGVVQFERDAPGAFTRRDLSRIQALASQAAATLANVRAHQDVYSQAVTDALTGLYNRRHMQTVLADERRRAQRYSHPLSVIMLDVDGFKNYNDTYGHVQGDILLKMLSGILQANVRGVDIVGRFGGEEFLVVLPETPSEEAYQTAERLRLAVAQTIFPGFANDPDLAVFKTISLGIATFPDITHDTQALVTLADNALYRAKRGGRNQTIQAEAETLILERE
jgi:diguanylate cyclase (GGDEF)-like protein